MGYEVFQEGPLELLPIVWLVVCFGLRDDGALLRLEEEERALVHRVVEVADRAYFAQLLVVRVEDQILLYHEELLVVLLVLLQALHEVLVAHRCDLREALGLCRVLISPLE